MVKQSPSRNHRSRGIKVKHVLQICVLLAICCWLIYQVKHSHDKKKAFDENDAKISLKTHVPDEILKFGRKDIARLEETTMKNEKHDEEEAEEEIGGGGEENKHEEEEQEVDKIEEKEDEGRGGGDDEIDEHDQEKPEMEVDHEEDFIDEEKEREEGDETEAEEKDAEYKEGQNENENSLEDHDHDGGSRNAHEAREEHYKADDASSAVTHENTEVNSLEEENKGHNTEEITVSQNTTGLKAEEGNLAENGISPNVTGKEDQGYENVPSKSEDISLSNSTMATESNNQPEVSNNSTEGSSETNNLSLQNRTEIKPDAIEDQNATVGGTTSEDSNLQTSALGQENNSNVASNNNQSDSNLSISGNTENAEVATGESSNSSTTSGLAITEKVITSNASVEVEGHSGSLTIDENNDATQNEKSETINGTDESWDSSETGNADDAHQDPIDYSDSSVLLEEKDVRTDLNTLPEIRTEGSNNEDAAAE